MKKYQLRINTDPIPDCPGNHGYPSFATKIKGKLILERMLNYTLNKIESYNFLSN
ncbi:MAG: hypothetical protein ABIA04_10800 [Pseudomonadota bacterium]